LHSFEDYRRASRRYLPKMIFDYIEGGAGREACNARNVDAFEKCVLAPRRLIDVAKRDTTIGLFGRRWPVPFAIAPMGLAGAVRPGGDLILAGAAHRAGIPFCLSTAATSTVEEVRRVSDGEIWFQLYVVERSLADQLITRAKNAGCETLILTVDVPVNGERLRDARSGFGLPFRYTPRILWDAAMHPRWSLRLLTGGPPQLAHFRSKEAGSADSQAALMRRQMDASFAWNDLARLRDRWKGKLLVKGVLRADDARRCELMGIDGVIVSNHGGRQLDQSPAALQATKSVAAAVSCPVLMDSGIRSGSDVLCALAHGAAAALVGRPMLHALAAHGADGVSELIALFRRQLDTAMALAGCADLSDVDQLMI